MRSGITLIEVAIGILLASMLASILFISFSQLQLTSGIIESFIEVDMRSAIVMHTMLQDFSGAFVPQLALAETSTIKQVPVATVNTEKAAMPFDVTTVFKLEHKNKNIDMITCITNNPITVYDIVKPRIVRVVYRLIADKESEGAFRLIRQESVDLSLKAFEKTGTEAIRAYELAHNIKSCVASCIFLEYSEPTAEQQKQGIKEIVPIVRTVKDWIYDPKKEKEQKLPFLPFAIRLQCVFWDDRHKREWPVEFFIPIFSFEPYHEKKKELKKQQSSLIPENTVKNKADQVDFSTQIQSKKVTVQLQLPENISKLLAKQKDRESS